jgi:23S rRNA (uridine2552-2'-O)-methyltransferase
LKKKFLNRWLAKRNKDPFFSRSKIQGYRSRSAYKLMEMDKKFKFLKNNTLLLDLGSSPGGWAQVAKKKINKGKILGVDIKSMDKIKGVDFIMRDFNDKIVLEKIIAYFNKRIDVVLSDMAANTSGNKDLDSYRTGELCLNAMNLAKKILSQEGVFLTKVFMGSIFKEINKEANCSFKQVVKYKPLSSKKESKEIYIFCKGILNV